MTPQELHLRRVKAFRDLASQELEAARILAPTLRGQSVYFLQQCVEKLARGLLEMEKVQVGPTHEIARLADMLPAGNEFTGVLRKMDILSPAATRFRYPGGTGNIRSIEATELDSLLQGAQELHDEIVPVLSLYLANDGRR